MPLPMVHLAIAVQIHRLEERSLCQDFLLGSIAPDAIHMRPNAGHSDKLRVHLSEKYDLRYDVARKLLTHYDSNNVVTMGFTEGYVAHLLTDYLWGDSVIDSFYKRIPQNLSPEETRELYYQETDQIDFNLYYQMPWRKDVWSLLAVTQPKDFASLLTSEEIKQWRDRVLNWFEDFKKESMIAPIHITYEETLDFVNRVAEEIVKVLNSWKSHDETVRSHRY